MLAPAWQIALAVLVGFLMGALCTYVASRIADQSPAPDAQGHERVGAEGSGQATGAPQGRPDDRNQGA